MSLITPMSKNEHKRTLPKYLHGLTEDDVKELFASDKDIVKQFAKWVSEPSRVTALEATVTNLSQENLRLRTVMFAAYQEIVEFWDAHCDKEGYGPQSLLRHLKDGTGYYPGYVSEVTNPSNAVSE